MEIWKVEVYNYVNGVRTLVAFADGLNHRLAKYLHELYYDEGYAEVHSFKTSN